MLCPTVRFIVLLMLVEKSVTRIVFLDMLLTEAHCVCSLRGTNWIYICRGFWTQDWTGTLCCRMGGVVHCMAGSSWVNHALYSTHCYWTLCEWVFRFSEQDMLQSDYVQCTLILWARIAGRCSDWLWTGRSEDRIPVGAKFSAPDRPWGPPNLLYNGYQVFPRGKATGAWHWPPIPPSAKVEERVEL